MAISKGYSRNINSVLEKTSAKQSLHLIIDKLQDNLYKRGVGAPLLTSQLYTAQIIEVIDNLEKTSDTHC